MEKKYTVLFVDDEPRVLTAIERMFRRSRHEILLAESGPRALELLKEKEVHVLITDHRMPAMTGVELCRIVARTYPMVFRFILSAYTDMEDMIEAIEHGEVQRFLSKPSDMPRLVDVVERAIEQSQVILGFKRLVDDLNRKGGKYHYEIDAMLGMIAVKINDEDPTHTKDLAACLMRCLFENQETEGGFQIVSSVLQRHNGTLAIHADFGSGIRMAIELPTAEKNSSDEE